MLTHVNYTLVMMGQQLHYCYVYIPYTSYILWGFYFAEMGKSLFYKICNFTDGCVGLVPRHTESNFRGYLFSRMAIDSQKYSKLNPPRNIRRIRYIQHFACFFLLAIHVVYRKCCAMDSGVQGNLPPPLGFGNRFGTLPFPTARKQ